VCIIGFVFENLKQEMIMSTDTLTNGQRNELAAIIGVSPQALRKPIGILPTSTIEEIVDILYERSGKLTEAALKMRDNGYECRRMALRLAGGLGVSDE